MARKPVKASRTIQTTPPERNNRLDAFVDAAFAFAVTLLVISADRVPDSMQALRVALKTLPSFAASFTMVALFWLAHVRWSRRYRLETATATWLSLVLVFLVLVYVYPLRLLFGTFFSWISNGWLPMPLRAFDPLQDVVSMYLVYGVAFVSMSACMAGLYLHAWRRRRVLALDAAAAADAMADVASYLGFIVVGLLSVLTAWLLPAQPTQWHLALPGFLYFLLALTGLVDAAGRRWALRRLRAGA